MIPLNSDTSYEDVKFLVVDLFCGAGGTSSGFEMASKGKNKTVIVMAAVNHDPIAIKSHWQNHKHVVHYEEDITKLYGQVYNGVLHMTDHMRQLVRLVDIYRALYPNAKVVLFGSLECTNFSKAKGGQAREADSRTLADHMDRYVAALDPDYIMIENVVEFMSWGPLNDKGKPISSKNGRDWLRWKQHICDFGYRTDWKEMNSANFGAFTSRNRLFGIFAKSTMPIAWPAPTHAKTPGKQGMFGDLKKWKAVKEVLDFEDEGISIFNRKKPLVNASLERIHAGLVKFVAGGKDAFILKYNSTGSDGKHYPPSIDEPCPTIACQNRLGIVNTSFLAKYYSGKPSGKVIPTTGPAGTITCADGQSLVQVKQFISQRNGGDPAGRIVSVESPARTLTSTGGNQELVNVQPFIMNTNFKNVGRSIEEPAPTLTASRHHPYVVTPAFLMASNGGHKGSKVFPVSAPCRTITVNDNKSIVNPVFLTQYYSNGGELASVDEPARTLGTKDTIAKIQTSFFDKTFTGNSNVSSVEEPAGTIMPNDKHRLINCEAFILNPSHGGHSTSVEVPSPVIIARQDKAPLYLIQYDLSEDVCIPVYEEDSDVMIRIKTFMAMYGISDIKMRMLKVPELLRIQGFPANYVLCGNQTDQKKFIGNSVVPHVITAWIEALGQELDEIYQLAA